MSVIMRLECNYCGSRFTAENLDENCPKCGAPNCHPFRPPPSDNGFPISRSKPKIPTRSWAHRQGRDGNLIKGAL